ncbi:MAG: lysozyme inhibitor LprI family protein [Desulforegulaceae bacterium]|nr:lysozyme inhibitor LprI family protein [Desulforegulaceae bacterium]
MFNKVLFILLLLIPAGCFSAGFDCEKAENSIDKSICSEEKLSRLDKQMSDYYFKLKSSVDKKKSEKLLKDQRKWLSQRSVKCSVNDIECLTRLYKDRIFTLRKDYENLVPYNSVNLSDLQGLRGQCSFDIDFPEDLVVYSGGYYSGKKLDRQIDQSGHQATQFEVIVNSPDKPVALILGAYEPSIWNIAWTQGTQISAVAATGYHRQAVAGLPNDVPVLISSYDNRGPCGYLYVSEKNLKKINPLSQKIFGKNVDMVFLASNGRLVFGKKITESDNLFTSKDNPPESFFDKSLPLAGEAGLKDLVKKGFMRKAESNDIERWAKLKADQHSDELPPVSSGETWKSYKPQYVHNAYVILRQITIPAGLYGGNSVTFFLEKGVPYPEGKLGHSTLYDFNSLSCEGTGCEGY